MYTKRVSEASVANWVEPLNPRELEVVGLISDGLSNNEIALTLHLSLDTVKWYNKLIFSKLGVKNRTQAAKKAETIDLQKSEIGTEKEYTVQWSSNLPAQLTSYVGRKNEVSELKELLKHNRMVTLTGSGGSGKTRLALKVADDLGEYFRDGVWFVELAVEDDPDRLPDAISRVLKIFGGVESMSIDGLKRYLSSKHMMLILDNFEHLISAAPMIGDLLAACPKLTVLTTSREKLHVYGEQEYAVQPLDFPKLSKNKSVKELLDYEAVRLFVDRARAAQPGFILDDDQARAITRICELLDGLPLAIELCAPQVKISSLKGIVERLEDSLDFLPKGPRDIPARQRTLKATLEWSYNLLSKDERVLFTRLAVFKGGGTLDAIEIVCGKDISGVTSEIVFSLVDKNLVIPREGRDGEMHFTLLQTIRDLNAERLRGWGVTQEMNRSHASYYTNIAEQADQEIRGYRNAYWFKRLKTENDNLRSALWWSINSQEPEFALRLVNSLEYHWIYHGLAAESLRWEDRVVEIAAKVNPKLRAGVLRTLGNLAYSLGNLEKSHKYLNEAVKLFQDLGDEVNEAWSSLFLGLSYVDSEDKILEGLRMAQNAISIFRERVDMPRLAYGLNILGEIARVAGNIEQAKEYYQESLTIAKETGEVVREAIQYLNLGFIAYHQENYQLAMELNNKSLKMFWELDSFYGMASHLASAAGPVGALGYHTRAARLLGAANALLVGLDIGQQFADQVEINRYLEMVQDALGEHAFQEAWEEGQRMTIQEALEYALSDVEGGEE